MTLEIIKNTFADFDEEISVEEVTVAKKCVSEIADTYGI